MFIFAIIAYKTILNAQRNRNWLVTEFVIQYINVCDV